MKPDQLDLFTHSRNMQGAEKQTLVRQVPEFRVSYTITTDKFDALYKQLKPKGVTLTALLAKAAGVALASHPVLYACESLSPLESSLAATCVPCCFC